MDEDGYRIRPKDADKIAKFSDDESSHDDSSDFESDSDNGNYYYKRTCVYMYIVV